MEQDRKRSGCLAGISIAVVILGIATFIVGGTFLQLHYKNFDSRTFDANLCVVIFIPVGLGIIGSFYYGVLIGETFTDSERRALSYQAAALIAALLVLYSILLLAVWQPDLLGAVFPLAGIFVSFLVGAIGLVAIANRVTIITFKGASNKGANAVIFGFIDIIVALIGILSVVYLLVR